MRFSNIKVNLVTAIMNDPNLHNLPTYQEENAILSTGFIDSQDLLSTFSSPDSINTASITENSQFLNLIQGITTASGGFLSQFSFPGDHWLI